MLCEHRRRVWETSYSISWPCGLAAQLRTGHSQLELGRGINAKALSFALEGIQDKQYVTSMDKVAAGEFGGLESYKATSAYVIMSIIVHKASIA